MVHPTLIVAVDLGTSATTSSHTRVRDSFDNQGKLHREKLGSVSDVTDWPGCIEGATGNNCVPTDLIYLRSTRELLYWGFEAKEYLDDEFHPLSRSDVFVVETIKLLLPDPDEAKVPSATSERYRAMRKTLTATLNKAPEEVFEDFLSQVFAHVLESATRKYSIPLHNPPDRASSRVSFRLARPYTHHGCQNRCESFAESSHNARSQEYYFWN